MRLPKYSNLAVFHTASKVDGLSIPRLFPIIPLLRFNCIKLIKSNDNPLIVSWPNNIIMKRCRPRYYYNVSLTTKANIKYYNIDRLFNSADGKGLRYGTYTTYTNAGLAARTICYQAMIM